MWFISSYAKNGKFPHNLLNSIALASLDKETYEWKHPLPRNFNKTMYSILGKFDVRTLKIIYTVFRDKKAIKTAAKKENISAKEAIEIIESALSALNDERYIYGLQNGVLLEQTNGKLTDEINQIRLAYDYPVNLIKTINRIRNSMLPPDKQCNDTEYTLPEDYDMSVEHAMSILSSRNRKIIVARYRDKHTLEDIGKKHKITKEYVRQNILKSLEQLTYSPCYEYMYYGIEAVNAIHDYKKRRISKQPFSIDDNSYLNLNGLPDSMTVNELNVSKRIKNALKNNDINTVKDLKQFTINDLTQMRNIGYGSMYEIISRCNNYDKILTSKRRDTMYKYAILGRTGSGRAFVQDNLIKNGFKIAKSCTTRDPIDNNDKSHKFITDEEYKKICENSPETMLLKTEHNGIIYYYEKQELDDADIIPIDPENLKALCAMYPDTPFRLIMIMADDKDRLINAVKNADDKLIAEEEFLAACEDENDAFKAFEDAAMNNKLDIPNVFLAHTYTNTFDDNSDIFIAAKQLAQDALIAKRLGDIIQTLINNKRIDTDEDGNILVFMKESGLTPTPMSIFIETILADPEGMTSVVKAWLSCDTINIE